MNAELSDLDDLLLYAVARIVVVHTERIKDLEAQISTLISIVEKCVAEKAAPTTKP